MGLGREIEVSPAQEDDLRHTAVLHVAELPHGLFPRLGEKFVRRWQRAHLRSEYGVLLVARSADGVVGFVLGTTDRQANVAWIIRHHRRELLGAGIRVLLLRPRLAWRFVRTRGMRYVRRVFARSTPSTGVVGRGNLPEARSAPVAVLEALVVTPHARGKAIGTALVERYLGIAARAGAERVELVTKAGTGGAAGFYEHHGWTMVGSHVDRDGDRVLTYRINPRVVEKP